MKKTRTRKPHLFKPKDVLRVLRACRGDLQAQTLKNAPIYSEIYMELLHQFVPNIFTPEQNDVLGAFKRMIEFALYARPQYMMFAMHDIFYFFPPNQYIDVGEILELLEGFLPKR